MIISGTRFGEIEIEEARVLSFARGLVGFPEARRFVLLGPAPGRAVAWLQCLDRAELAFPVMPATVFAGASLPPTDELAREANLPGDDVAVLIVVAAGAGEGLVANMLAPIVVDPGTSAGAQIVLDPRRYSARLPVGGSSTRQQSAREQA